MHDVASMGSGSERKQHRSYHPRSALQKLLSMVEPIMRPLTIELYETEKEEVNIYYLIFFYSLFFSLLFFCYLVLSVCNDAKLRLST